MTCASCGAQTDARPCERCGGEPWLGGTWALTSPLPAARGTRAFRALREGRPPSLVVRISTDLEGGARLVNEGQVLGEVRHRAAPTLVEAGETWFGGEEVALVVTDLRHGGDLAEEVEARRWTDGDVLYLLHELLDLLEALHGLPEPVVHGAVEPANVRLDAEGRLTLTGFGSAGREGEPAPDRAGVLLPPEWREGGARSPAGDVWMVGALALHLLWQAAPATRLRDDGRLDPAAPAPCPPGLQALLDALLAEEPERRPSAAEARARVLELAGGGLRPVVLRRTQPVRRPRPKLPEPIRATRSIPLAVEVHDPEPTPPPGRLSPVRPTPQPPSTELTARSLLRAAAPPAPAPAVGADEAGTAGGPGFPDLDDAALAPLPPTGGTAEGEGAFAAAPDVAPSPDPAAPDPELTEPDVAEVGFPGPGSAAPDGAGPDAADGATPASLRGAAAVEPDAEPEAPTEPLVEAPPAPPLALHPALGDDPPDLDRALPDLGGAAPADLASASDLGSPSDFGDAPTAPRPPPPEAPPRSDPPGADAALHEPTAPVLPVAGRPRVHPGLPAAAAPPPPVERRGGPRAFELAVGTALGALLGLLLVGWLFPGAWAGLFGPVEAPPDAPPGGAPPPREEAAPPASPPSSEVGVPPPGPAPVPAAEALAAPPAEAPAAAPSPPATPGGAASPPSTAAPAPAPTSAAAAGTTGTWPPPPEASAPAVTPALVEQRLGANGALQACAAAWSPDGVWQGRPELRVQVTSTGVVVPQRTGAAADLMTGQADCVRAALAAERFDGGGFSMTLRL